MSQSLERTAEPLSLGASIVLYRTPVRSILPLVEQFLAQGVSLLYLIDNSPAGFDAFAGWEPPERVVTIATRINLGYGRANNIAIRDSVRRHEFHLVCNPDITLGANLLTELCDYLRRNPDEAAYNAWVNTLKNKPLRDPDAARSMVCNFLNSTEYQNRFSIHATHTTRECN